MWLGTLVTQHPVNMDSQILRKSDVGNSEIKIQSKELSKTTKTTGNGGGTEKKRGESR